MVKEYIKKELVSKYFEDDRKLTEYVSEALNIHSERLNIIEKNAHNSENKVITKDQLILIINENDIKIFKENKELKEHQQTTICKQYILFQDITQSNDLSYNRQLNQSTNSIIVLNDDQIISTAYCDEVKDILDRVIDRKENTIEKWEHNQNVNCLYFNSDNLKFKDNEEVKELDKNVFQIISKVVQTLDKDYGIVCRGDSGYCFRKIYGPTRLHKDGVNVSAVNNHLPTTKIRNMSVIIALNDNYEGGEFYFPKQDYKVKLKKGDIICFPPYHTHPHMVYSPLNRTYRYTINTWLYE